MSVSIGYATLRGALDKRTGIHSFRGIPYAEPPVGARRWMPPQPIERSRGIVDAMRHRAIPAQPFQAHQRLIAQKLFFTPREPQSEDCLHLNVWTSTLDRNARLPVMMWVPGGGFRGGSSASPLYDGAALASQGIVLVSINYRVSRFGFLAHPWLTAASPDGSSGNYGLLDQIAALEWIRDHIAAFGGDPANVTIFGQSAGSQSVAYLMSAPKAKGLFHRAITQSGSPIASSRHPGLVGRHAQTLAEAEAEGESVVARLRVSNLHELREVSTETLLNACPPNSFTSSRPIIDGFVIPYPAAECFARGMFNDVPLLCGTTEREGSIFDCQWDIDQHRAFCDTNLGVDQRAYFALYPITDGAASRLSSTLAYGDRMYAWPTHALARAHARGSRNACFLYSFGIAPPVSPDDQVDCRVGLGAFHGAELFFVFGNFYPTKWGWTPAHLSASARMSNIWTQFARTGSPNTNSHPNWPAYNPESDSLMRITDAGFDVCSASSPRLEFWNNLAG
jgi:para-nitrobenzyl esterase